MQTWPFMLLALVSVNRGQDFKTTCEDLTDGPVRAHYFRSRCYVLDPTAKAFDDIYCDHLDAQGHLALLPGTMLVAKILDLFAGHITGIPWIGVRRNQTSAPANSRDVYYWTTPKQAFHAPAVLTDWASGEPNQAGCGLLWVDQRKLGDEDCNSAVAGGYVCEYHEHTIKFKSKVRGVRGAAIATVAEYKLQNPLMECATKCKRSAICHSFTVSKAKGLCALHMLPTEELPTEALSDGVVFDIF